MWRSRHKNLNDFLELHENEPEMAMLGVELEVFVMSYLVRLFLLLDDFLEIVEFVSRISCSL